jgi:glycosyltransferase involved in cell wall biosynthesis
MYIVVIYDFDVNKGGGDFVMLNILEALRSAGHKVFLLTSYPKGLWESARFFEKPVPNVNIRFIKAPSFLKHPYTIAYVARKAAGVGSNAYDAYVVSDDIPTCIINRRGVCYMHYPHAARLNFKEYVAIKYKATLHGRLAWKIHKALFPRLYSVNRKPEEWLLIANSLVTRRHAAETFYVDIEDIILLNPPVASRAINEMWRTFSLEKEDLVVCVGRFELEKHFSEVLYALARLKKKIMVKLSLIGFAYDESSIRRVIRALGLEKCVELLVNAERKALIDKLLRAKAIVHPTPHEPFGIAVVEGMAAGCIPVVKRGVNGPWIEITQKGEYGLGFSSVDELSNMLMKAIRRYDDFNINAITLRALEFDETIFKEKFLKMLKSFGN